MPDFAKVSGHTANVIWLPAVEITERLNAGEQTDLVFSPKNAVSAQIAKGTLIAADRADPVQSGVGMGIAKGARRPGVSTPEALKATLLAARSIGYATGPSGDHVAVVIKSLGIEAALAPKTTIIQGFVGKAVESGQVEIGFQQVPEILLVPGIDLLGPLPGDLQKMTTFSIAMHRSTAKLEACRAFIRYFSSRALAPEYRKHGLEPL